MNKWKEHASFIWLWQRCVIEVIIGEETGFKKKKEEIFIKKLKLESISSQKTQCRQSNVCITNVMDEDNFSECVYLFHFMAIIKSFWSHCSVTTQLLIAETQENNVMAAQLHGFCLLTGATKGSICRLYEAADELLFSE